MKKNLKENELFLAFENVIDTLGVLLHKQEIVFLNSPEGIFAKEVIFRLYEESLGYLADFREGAFFASNHHTRALSELFATVVLISSDKNNKKRYLERFIRFPEIEFYKIYHRHEDSVLDLNSEILEKYFKKYAELNDDLLEIFNKKNKDELLTMESWRGNCNIEKLFEKLPDNKVHSKNYGKLCQFVHISSFVRRSETGLFPVFTLNNELMLAITVKYVFDSYVYIRDQRFFDEENIRRLDEVFSPIVAPLLAKIEPLITK